MHLGGVRSGCYVLYAWFSSPLANPYLFTSLQNQPVWGKRDGPTVHSMIVAGGSYDRGCASLIAMTVARRVWVCWVNRPCCLPAYLIYNTVSTAPLHVRMLTVPCGTVLALRMGWAYLGVAHRGLRYGIVAVMLLTVALLVKRFLSATGYPGRDLRRKPINTLLQVPRYDGIRSFKMHQVSQFLSKISRCFSPRCENTRRRLD